MKTALRLSHLSAPAEVLGRDLLAHVEVLRAGSGAVLGSFGSGAILGSFLVFLVFPTDDLAGTSGTWGGLPEGPSASLTTSVDLRAFRAFFAGPGVAASSTSGLGLFSMAWVEGFLDFLVPLFLGPPLPLPVLPPPLPLPLPFLSLLDPSGFSPLPLPLLFFLSSVSCFFWAFSPSCSLRRTWQAKKLDYHKAQLAQLIRPHMDRSHKNYVQSWNWAKATFHQLMAGAMVELPVHVRINLPQRLVDRLSVVIWEGCRLSVVHIDDVVGQGKLQPVEHSLEVT